MKSTLKKALSVLLAVTILFGTVAFGITDVNWSEFAVKAKAATIGSYKQGDIIEFGWYPQSKVTDESLISALNSADGDWISYGYYSGSGSYDDGQMTAKDYMRYKDVMYGFVKYRGVVFDTYRPNHTGDTPSKYYTGDSPRYTYQDDNGYYIKTTYWFRYEPIEWRVLDLATGMVMSETILDSQAYNNYILYNGTDEYGNSAYWGDPEQTCYSNNYANSSIREWLNKDFYNTAFSIAQQNIINYTSLDNSAYSESYSAFDSEATNDKIYLLSWDDVLNTSYGFSSNHKEYDVARRAQVSDYAKCQGLYVTTGSSYNGNSNWHLRSAGINSGKTCNVGFNGTTYNSSGIGVIESGIRPALNFNLNSEIFQSNISESKTCITEMKIIDHGHYEGNMGDSCIFHLDKSGLPGIDNQYGRNDNIGLDGTERNNGIEAWLARWNFENEISWAYATYSLEGKYKTLSCKTDLLGSYNTSSFDTTVYFYDGDTLLYSVTLTDDNYNYSFFVDVTGVEELTVKVMDNTATSGGTSFALYDMFLYTVPADEIETYYNTNWIVDGEILATYEIPFGGAITAPTAPQKDGYKFAGWTPEVPETMPNKDLTFTAMWEEVGSSEDPDTPSDSDDCETVVGVLEEYELSAVLNGNSYWISRVCIDGKWFNLYVDYEYQEKIDSYEGKQVVAVIYNDYVSSICLLTELETNPEIYNFKSSLPTLEYYDGVFRKYNGSRADKWHTANGTISNPLSSVLIDDSKIPSSESLKLRNVSVTIESSDKKIISLDNGFWDIESDSMTIELGDIEVGESINFSEKVLNLKTGWNFPKDKKEHSVTLYYTVTGTLNGETITRETSETIKLINNDYSSGGSGASTSYKKQSIRELFEEMQSKVMQCDALNSTERLLVHSIISSHLVAMDVADLKNTLDAAEKVYEIARYISGIDSVTYWTAGEYVIDAIMDEAYKGDDELKEAMEDLLGDLRKSKEFNTFIKWYYDQQNTKKNSNKRIDARCPIDVYVNDKNGKQVLSIVNNVITDADEEIHAFVCENDKIFYLPTDTDYDIKIIATDNGTMDYIVTEYNSENDLRKTYYDNIPLVKDGYYIGEIVSETTPDADVYNLHDSNGTEIGYDECTVTVEDATNPSEPSTEPIEVPTAKPIEPSTKPTEPTTKPAEPTTKPTEPSTKPVVTVPVPSVEIRRPSQTEIKYGDSIILHADIDGDLPNGAKIVWTADNDNFTYTASADGATCTVSPSANGDTVFTATVYDADGNEICSDTQTMTAKAGFFQKIIAFFKKIFGLTKVIPEAFKNI